MKYHIPYFFVTEDSMSQTCFRSIQSFVGKKGTKSKALFIFPSIFHYPTANLGLEFSTL